MAEYIEREALINEFKRLTLGENSLIERLFADGVYAVLETFSAADVAPVVHGEWKFEHDPINDPKKYFIRIVCSCCGLKTGQKSNYCPNCGAKMDGGKPNEEL